MISHQPTDAPDSQPSDAKAETARLATPVMNPRKPIEVDNGGNGTVNNPPGADIKPPFTGGYETPV